jgi:Tim10/DDP family zinc finger
VAEKAPAGKLELYSTPSCYGHVHASPPTWPTALTTPHRSAEPRSSSRTTSKLTLSSFHACRKSSRLFSTGSRRRRVSNSLSTPLPLCAGTSAFSHLSLVVRPQYNHCTPFFFFFFGHRCITGTPSTRFSRGEESCLVNCVERFLDTSLFMVKKIESQRQGA